MISVLPSDSNGSTPRVGARSTELADAGQGPVSDGTQKIAEVVAGGNGQRSAAAPARNGSDNSRKNGAGPQKPGNVVVKGKWLEVQAVEKRGELVFRLVGQLPVFNGKAPRDLEELLIVGKTPPPLDLKFNTEAEARSMLDRIEQAYNGVVVERALRETVLTESELRQCEGLIARLRRFQGEHPDFVSEAADEYYENHGNELIRIGLQELVERMIEELGPTVSSKRPQRWRWGVNQICEVAGGAPTGDYDKLGNPVKNLTAGELSPHRLKTLLRKLPRNTARAVLDLLRPVLEFAVTEGYLRKNPAAGMKLRRLRATVEAKADEEIVIDSNDQVQIALNVAGAWRNGYFVPHVVLIYHAALRPECELRRLKPKDIQLHKKLIRVYSTKTEWRRIVHLSESAVAMLKHYWDGKPLRFDGWEEFLAIMRSAQGYIVKTPKWFTPPAPLTLTLVPDIPRHTGNSNYIWWGDAVKDTYRGGQAFRVFRANYDGLVPRDQGAQFLVLLPDTMPVDEALKAAIRMELTKYKLVDDDKLPLPPVVPKINLDRPLKKLWLPDKSDAELVATVFRLGRMAAARELGTNPAWLSSIFAAKRLPMPPPGRYHTANPEDYPTPPPVVNISNAELEEMLRVLHGIQATARKLEVNPDALTAHCLLNGITTPTQRELGQWRGKLPRVKLSPQQIQVLLGREDVEEVARKAGVGVEHLRRYCSDHGIEIPAENPPEPPTVDLEVIKAAVAAEMFGRSGRKLKSVEALELVLSRAPLGLTDSEIIAVLGAAGVPFTPMQIRYVVMESAKGRFERYNGRVHLMKPKLSVDLDKLKGDVTPEIQTKTEWTRLDAIRCLLGRARNGLTLQQLSSGLAWFGIVVDAEALKVDIRRYAGQARLQVYRGTVTLPQTAPSWTLRVADKEPTPNLADIRSTVCREFGLLANQKLTNVEMMDFVLGYAPNGLWTEEFLAITASLGVNFKESCIQSVTAKETKDRFLRKNGRVSLVGPATARVSINDLQKALNGNITVTKQTTHAELFINVLRNFPGGLDLLDFQAAVGLFGYRSGYGAFKRKVYYLASEGRLEVTKGRAVVAAPQPPGSPEAVQPPTPEVPSAQAETLASAPE